MAGKKFDFWRAVEDVVDAFSDAADDGDDGNASDSAGPSRADGRNRNRNEGEASSSPDPLGIAVLTGIGALGLAAFAHKSAHRREHEHERKTSKPPQTPDARKGKARSLLENFDRHRKTADSNRDNARRTVRNAIEKPERKLRARADILAVNPSEERLLDKREADRFFQEQRQRLAEARQKSETELQSYITHLDKIFLGFYPGDSTFKQEAARHLASWKHRQDKSDAHILDRLEKMETALADIRAVVERGAEGPITGLGELRFLYVPTTYTLNADDIALLTSRMVQPRDPQLSSLFEDMLAGNIDDATAKTRLADFAWTGTALADVMERAQLYRTVSDRMGINKRQTTQTIDRFGILCAQTLRGIPAEELDLSGEDAARIAAAMIAGFEGKNAGIHRVLWQSLSVAAGQVNAKLRQWITREEAAVLAERIERPAMRHLDAIERKQDSGRLFAPFADLLRILREAARIDTPSPALAMWEELLSTREAARLAILRAVSPFWAPMLETILDAPPLDASGEAGRIQAIAEYAKPFRTFDARQLDAVAADISALLDDPYQIELSWRGDGWSTTPARYRGAPAVQIIEHLRDTLALPETERASVFALEAVTSDLGDFGQLVQAQERWEINSILESEAGDVLSAGRVEGAAAMLRRWAEAAPPHTLRDLILATGDSSLSVIGWQDFVTIAAKPGIEALGIDFSDHCVSGMIEGDGTELMFEAGGIRVSRFDFAATPLAELRAIGRTYGTPWQGAMDVSLGLSIVGLAPILQAQRRLTAIQSAAQDAERLQLERTMQSLAEWWCFTMSALVIRKAMLAHPLPRAIPLIVGTHDYGTRIPQVIWREVE